MPSLTLVGSTTPTYTSSATPPLSSTGGLSLSRSGSSEASKSGTGSLTRSSTASETAAVSVSASATLSGTLGYASDHQLKLSGTQWSAALSGVDGGKLLELLGASIAAATLSSHVAILSVSTSGTLTVVYRAFTPIATSSPTALGVIDSRAAAGNYSALQALYQQATGSAVPVRVVYSGAASAAGGAGAPSGSSCGTLCVVVAVLASTSGAAAIAVALVLLHRRRRRLGQRALSRKIALRAPSPPTRRVLPPGRSLLPTVCFPPLGPRAAVRSDRPTYRLSVPPECVLPLGTDAGVSGPLEYSGDSDLESGRGHERSSRSLTPQETDDGRESGEKEDPIESIWENSDAEISQESTFSEEGEVKEATG